MNLRSLPIAASALLFAAVCAPNSHAQAQAAQHPLPAQAQTQTPPPASQQPAAQDSAAPQPPAKKVWNNDDLNGLDPHTGVSTVGKSDPKPANPGTNSAPGRRSHDPQWYKQKISDLQAQLPPLDAQIAELQAAINGKPTGDAKESTRPAGVKFDNWQHELADFQKKRDNIAAQIATLQDQARHDGVPAKDIP